MSEYRIAIIRWNDIREGDVVRELRDDGGRGSWHVALTDGGNYARPELGFNLVEKQVEAVDPPVERAFSVQPGDRILLEVEGPNNPETIDRISQRLNTRWPDVDFVLLGGLRVVAGER